MGTKGECVKAKLCPCSLGFAIGIVKGFFLLFFAWLAWLSGYGISVVERSASYISSYDASFVGGLIGGAYGFVCGFIIGFLVAYVYNFCLSRCCKRKERIE